MKNEQELTFEKVANLLNGLPSAVVGEVVISLTKTMAEKYRDDPFELDFEIIEKQLLELLGYMQDGLPYDEIIKKMIRGGKIYKSIWTTINKSIITHFPIEEQRKALEIILVNGRMYIKKQTPTENASAVKDVKYPYAPNRKYQEWQFLEFEKNIDAGKKQSKAYDDLVEQYPNDFIADKMESFLVSYRKRNRDRYK